MIRVALEAAGEPPPPDANADEASLRTAVTSAIRAQDPDASEAAMRSLVEMGWRRVVAEDNRRTDDS
jgi:DNA-binding FadR family transcriptional regulator